MRRFILILSVLFIIATACSSAEVSSPPSHSLLEFPNGLTVNYDDGITEYERELIDFVIENVDKFIFQKSGLNIAGTVYVTSSRAQYISKLMEFFGYNQTTAENASVRSKGITHQHKGIVLINLELIRELHLNDDPAIKQAKTDHEIFFVVAHEWYHIAQAMLSWGWSSFSNTPSWITEATANKAADYVITAATCMDLGEISKFGIVIQDKECSEQEIFEKTYNTLSLRFMATQDVYYTPFLYLMSQYGIMPANIFYKELGNYAATLGLNRETFTGENFVAYQNSSWETSLMKVYGIENENQLFADSIRYVDTNIEDIQNRALIVARHSR